MRLTFLVFSAPFFFSLIACGGGGGSEATAGGSSTTQTGGGSSSEGGSLTGGPTTTDPSGSGSDSLGGSTSTGPAMTTTGSSGSEGGEASTSTGSTAGESTTEPVASTSTGDTSTGEPSTTTGELLDCTQWQQAFDAEVLEIRGCSEDAECGQELVGTSCGCTRNWVARIDADVTEFWALVDKGNELGCELPFISTCDCPETDGFACEGGICTWNYI